MPQSNVGLYGQGIGSAQVLGSNAAIPLIRQAMAVQQQKRDKEAQEMAASISSLNYDKTRQSDQPYFLDAYDKIKQTYNQARDTQDPKVKRDLQNELQKQQLQFKNAVSQSQEVLNHERTLGNLALNPNANLADGFGTSYKDLTGTSIFDKGYQDKAKFFDSPFKKQFDANKYETAAVKGALVPVSNYGETITRNLPGGVKQTLQEKGNDISRDKLLSQLHQDYLYNPNSGVADYVMGQSRNTQLSPDKVIEQYADDIIKRNASSYGSDLKTPEGRFQNPTKPSWIESYNMRVYGQPTKPKEQALPGQPVDVMNIPFAAGQNGKKENSVNLHGYVPISIPNKNFAGVPAIDLKTGQSVPALKSSGDYAIVGVGNAPFIKSDSKNISTQYKGKLAQPNFETSNPDAVEQKPMIHVQSKANGITHDYLLPYDRLPENVKNSKAVMAALSGFKPAGSGQQPVSSGKPRVISSDEDFKALRPGEQFLTPDGKLLRKK